MVELNTWFLRLRQFMNRENKKCYYFVNFCFYVTWFSVRLPFVGVAAFLSVKYYTEDDIELKNNIWCLGLLQGKTDS
jgi:hypothetical protein